MSGTSEYSIEAKNLNFSYGQRKIISNLNFEFKTGSFVAVLGSNGVGKTTLLDLIMGFVEHDSGSLLVAGNSPFDDPWQSREHIGYLSEKIDFPAAWSLKEALDFNSSFYKSYSKELEKELVDAFRVDVNNTFANMSAGESRQAQIVIGLSTNPKLLVIDEITAFLDIDARKTFLDFVKKINTDNNCTVVLTTNIPDDLAKYITDVLLLKNDGAISSDLNTFMNGADSSQFFSIVAKRMAEK